MKIQHLGKNIYVDKRIFEDFKIYVGDVVESNLDLLIVLSGAEGNGKSVLSRQIAWLISYILLTEHNIILNPTIENLHFNLNEYIKSSLGGQKFQINILDESRSVLNRKSSMTRESKKFTNYLSECRKLNQFHILNLPAFADLDKYVFLHRSRYFIHVVRSRDENLKIVRGTYIVYPKDKRLIACYENGYYEVPKFSPKHGGFKGSFPKDEAFDEMNKYEAKQKTIMEEKYIETESKENEIKSLEELERMKNILGVHKTAEIKGISHQTIYNRLEKLSKLKIKVIT